MILGRLIMEVEIPILVFLAIYYELMSYTCNKECFSWWPNTLTKTCNKISVWFTPGGVGICTPHRSLYWSMLDIFIKQYQNGSISAITAKNKCWILILIERPNLTPCRYTQLLNSTIALTLPFILYRCTYTNSMTPWIRDRATLTLW